MRSRVSICVSVSKRELFLYLSSTHWGLVTHICVSNLSIICSDNGLMPGWHQAIIWTNAGILLIQTLASKFSEIIIEVHTFSFKKMHLKMLSGKCPAFCLGLQVLTLTIPGPHYSLSSSALNLNGQIRLGGSVHSYFLYVQFLIRLAAVSYRSEKVRTMVCPAVRSVNKSHNTWDCVQNGAEYTICVLFTRLYYKAPGIILCTLICQIRHNYNCLEDDHCDATGHRKMSALGTAGFMVTTHEKSLMMWSFDGSKLFSIL